ncbi:hypothetical protein EK21DRAFT_100627 [Setomelanomma holmii]|uniref:Flavin-nucleotide-binding protein n=1 Tax=Setomelanomma holmii TaxID=210430 RepID=A0A9P4LLV1_9PLEO|nr:hypothetical protein EK21DRAFT_100627 [Setomelanomma holmii]
MAETTTYPKTPANTVNRYKHQATYDADTIHTIVNSTPVLHVSFCYLHGYVSSCFMNLACSDARGLPLCVAATKVDGFVLTLTPSSHNYSYRSAVLQGYGTVVENVEEKLWAMKIDHQLRGTGSLRQHALREGCPEDERKDMKREEVLDTVWTGVIPVYERLGTPVPGPYNRVQEVPNHVGKWKHEENERREEYAREAGNKSAPLKRPKKSMEV